MEENTIPEITYENGDLFYHKTNLDLVFIVVDQTTAQISGRTVTTNGKIIWQQFYKFEVVKKKPRGIGSMC